jgi:MscS family membrane protein
MAVSHLIAASRNLRRPRQSLSGRFLINSLVFWAALTLLSVAQISPSSRGQTASPAQEQQADPLGRSTPRGTISAVIHALHRDDFVSAARYMQITPKQRPNTEELVRDLKDLMDRYFNEPIASISDSPTGALDDGLPLDRERVPLKLEGKAADIMLVRVTDPQSGQVWVISSDTLARVPALHNDIEKTWMERVMPGVLLERTLFGFSIGQWIVWGTSLAGPLLLLWLLGRLGTVLLRRVVRNPSRRRLVESWNNDLRWPTIVVLVLIIHVPSVFLLGSSLTFRISYVRFGSILAVLAIAWLFRRLAKLSFEHARVMVKRRGQSGTESLILLGERVFSVVILIVAVFTILIITGVDTKAALTGVGIGGVAVALGAQKTVENLLGGVFLLTDKAIAIGDTCCISSRVGTVEDITLRSVRLRTAEQTLLSIPAGVLSQANIENYATRRKTLVKAKLQLAYDTNAGQLRSALSGIRRLLSENAHIEQETSYVRLVDFGPQAIELELFSYILTSDGLKFLAIRENLLLEIAEVVESAGSHFARPTQFVYLESSPSGDSRSDGKKRLRDGADAAADIKAIAKRAG